VRAPKSTAAATSAWGAVTRHPGRRSARWVAPGVAASLVAVYVLLALGPTSLAIGASALCATIAVAWGLPHSASLLTSPRDVRAKIDAGLPRERRSPGENAAQSSPGRYLDIDAVEVEAVYVLGAEVFTHLTGGVGSILDPLSGNERHIETSDVSLTWRCQGRRSAAKLANRLNEWEARGAHLRLMATRGRCALLIEDDDHWVALPELRLGT
jgi:hypothetical protein